MGYNDLNKLEAIHLSTRTLFKRFCWLHHSLRQKYRWYYNWHLRPNSSLVHWVTIFLVIIGLEYGFLNFFKPSKAAFSQPTSATSQPIISQSPETLDTSKLEAKIDILGEQISQLATNETVDTIQQELGDFPGLSSESTQIQIRDKIESNLAKDNNLIELLNRLGKGETPNQTLISSLSSLLAKTSTEATLSALLNKTETGLAKDETLQNSSESMNKNLAIIIEKLTGNLNTSISNWISSIAISNFPGDFPSSSIERGQEVVGSEYFQRTEDFYVWASRHSYGKIAFSGEIANPSSGEKAFLSLKVPVNHTYYLTALYLSSTSSQSNNVKIYSTPSGEARSYVDRIIYDKKDSRTFSFAHPRKVSARDVYELVLYGENGASGTSTANIYYIDLPWEE